MNVYICKRDLRIDTGKSLAGSFVRATHVPSGITRQVDPVGSSDISEVIAELSTQVSDEVQNHSAPYQLWRLDDNDNEFRMQEFWKLEQAESMKEEYESRGHKQTYFVRGRNA